MPAFPRTNLRALAAGAERFARALPSLVTALAEAVPEPMTERLVESIMLLGGNLLDQTRDQQRHAYDLLADRCCPWLRRPIPAATIVAIDPPTAGRVLVPASSALSSAPIDGVRCEFRLLYDVMVGAFRVEDARVDARPGRPSVVRIRLRSTGVEPLNEALRDGLLLYVGGELETALQVVHALTARVVHATVEGPGWASPVAITADGIQRWGLGPDMCLAPDPDGMPAAFSAVTEAAVCPDKFRFFRLPATDLGAMPPTDALVLSFHLEDTSLVDLRLRPNDVQAHCVPAVNLFEATAEPIALDVEAGEVPVRVVDLPRRGGGVYAIVRAVAVAATGAHPSVALANVRRLAAAALDPRCPAVYATSLAERSDGDPDMTVTFDWRATAPVEPETERVVSMDVLATNRALGARARAGDLVGALRVGDQVLGFRNLTPASRYVPPPSGGSLAIRALRAARVTEGARDPLAALKETLFLSLPSWSGPDEWIRAWHRKVDSLESLHATIEPRPAAGGGVRRIYAYRLAVDESAFRGSGDLALFGATIGEALSRTAPVGTSVELAFVGRKGTFAATFPRGSG